MAALVGVVLDADEVEAEPIGQQHLLDDGVLPLGLGDREDAEQGLHRTRHPRLEAMEGSALTHLDATGQATMVDVGAKAATARWARARAVVRMSPEAAARVVAGDKPKGDVVAVARIAAIQAAKRTDELIPLCHQLPLSHVDRDRDRRRRRHRHDRRRDAHHPPHRRRDGGDGRRSVGALTVYDMVKGIEPGVVVERVELLDKTGGKSDFHRA